MKKLFLFTICIAFVSMYSFAQSGMPKLPGKIADIQASASKVASNIAKEVGGLTNEEDKGVKEATKTFLGDYNALLPKMKLDPQGFLSGLDKLKAIYDGKLTSVIGDNKCT